MAPQEHLQPGDVGSGAGSGRAAPHISAARLPAPSLLWAESSSTAGSETRGLSLLPHPTPSQSDRAAEQLAVITS